ncbi:hypothetical protein T492DRAFT_1146051 [Pavlovales sp. CCMP2436]|nr:hypothetical protein T492DRAFT_1146051 [Pavlovales sp. CCMP2436]
MPTAPAVTPSQQPSRHTQLYNPLICLKAQRTHLEATVVRSRTEAARARSESAEAAAELLLAKRELVTAKEELAGARVQLGEARAERGAIRAACEASSVEAGVAQLAAAQAAAAVALGNADDARAQQAAALAAPAAARAEESAAVAAAVHASWTALTHAGPAPEPQAVGEAGKVAVVAAVAAAAAVWAVQHAPLEQALAGAHARERVALAGADVLRQRLRRAEQAAAARAPRKHPRPSPRPSLASPPAGARTAERARRGAGGSEAGARSEPRPTRRVAVAAAGEGAEEGLAAPSGLSLSPPGAATAHGPSPRCEHGSARAALLGRLGGAPAAAEAGWTGPPTPAERSPAQVGTEPRAADAPPSLGTEFSVAGAHLRARFAPRSPARSLPGSAPGSARARKQAQQPPPPRSPQQAQQAQQEQPKPAQAQRHVGAHAEAEVWRAEAADLKAALEHSALHGAAQRALLLLRLGAGLSLGHALARWRLGALGLVLRAARQLEGASPAAVAAADALATSDAHALAVRALVARLRATFGAMRAVSAVGARVRLGAGAALNRWRAACWAARARARGASDGAARERRRGAAALVGAEGRCARVAEDQCTLEAALASAQTVAERATGHARRADKRASAAEYERHAAERLIGGARRQLAVARAQAERAGDEGGRVHARLRELEAELTVLGAYRERVLGAEAADERESAPAGGGERPVATEILPPAAEAETEGAARTLTRTPPHAGRTGSAPRHTTPRGTPKMEPEANPTVSQMPASASARQPLAAARANGATEGHGPTAKSGRPGRPRPAGHAPATRPSTAESAHSAVAVAAAPPIVLQLQMRLRGAAIALVYALRARTEAKGHAMRTWASFHSGMPG